ncbi:MAG: response regulator transcription factor [Planctomycetota bacterium]
MSEKPTILLVDDDQAFVKATSLFLEHAGYEVVSAPDGPSGVAAAMEHRPDIIVLDVIMRRPDEGFAVARALRAEPGVSEVPIVVLTAAGERYQMAFEPDEQWLPVNKVLEKPLAGDELVREIDALLGRSHSDEATP